MPERQKNETVLSVSPCRGNFNRSIMRFGGGCGLGDFVLDGAGAPFATVIAEHDRRIGELRRWRNRFADPGIASRLAAYFIEDYPKSARWSGYWSRMGASVRDALMQRGVASSSVFDPWTGRWSGHWHGSDASRSAQYHVWAPTRRSGGRFIQPVTQSTTRFYDADTHAEGWRSGRVDLGINVYGDADGITGWVSKRQGGQRLELPHIGYTLNPHTLLWITHDGHRFMMFFEWIAADRRTYGIHGRMFALSGGDIARHGLTGWAEYARRGEGG